MASPLLGLIGRSPDPGVPGVTYDLYDLRDSTHPRLLCTLTGAGQAHFISRTQIGYIVTRSDPSATTSSLVEIDLTTMRTQLVSTDDWTRDFARSGDGSVLASITGDQVWIKRGDGAPRTVRLPPMAKLGVDFALYNYQDTLKLSDDGQYVVVVNTTFGRLQVFDTASGALVWGAPPGTVVDIRTMAIWSRSGHRLYWRDNAGVHTWDPSHGAITLIPGLNWYAPSLSPDGHSVAYTVRDPQTFAPHVEVRNLDSGKVVVLPDSLRASPVFASPSTVWYAQERLTPDRLPPSSPTGGLFSYDLNLQRETELPIHAEFGSLVELWGG